MSNLPLSDLTFLVLLDAGIFYVRVHLYLFLVLFCDKLRFPHNRRAAGFVQLSLTSDIYVYYHFPLARWAQVQSTPVDSCIVQFPATRLLLHVCTDARDRFKTRLIERHINRISDTSPFVTDYGCEVLAWLG